MYLSDSMINKILKFKGDKKYLKSTYNYQVLVEHGGNYKGYDWMSILHDPREYSCCYVSIPIFDKLYMKILSKINWRRFFNKFKFDHYSYIEADDEPIGMAVMFMDIEPKNEIWLSFTIYQSEIKDIDYIRIKCETFIEKIIERGKFEMRAVENKKLSTVTIEQIESTKDLHDLLKLARCLYKMIILEGTSEEIEQKLALISEKVKKFTETESSMYIKEIISRNTDKVTIH